MPPSRPDDDRDDLPPSEAARARRRDHDASAGSRVGMRTGLAKQFKQILDAQVKRARQAGPSRSPADPATDGPDDEPPAAPTRKRGHPGHPRHRPPGQG